MKVGGVLQDNVIVGVRRGDVRRWDIARLNSNSVNDLECQTSLRKRREFLNLR